MLTVESIIGVLMGGFVILNWTTLFAAQTLFAAHASASGGPVHHDLQVKLNPPAHLIEVRDTVTLPEHITGDFSFGLHAGLAPAARTPQVKIARSGADLRGGVSVIRYRVLRPRGLRTFTLTYSGVIHHPLPDSGLEYARGINDTPGLIGAEGIYLTNESWWYPRILPDTSQLVTFTLEVEAPQNWMAVSQGGRSGADTGAPGHARWEELHPQNEIYLVGGPLTIFERAGQRLELLAYLRQPDQALADRYLGAADAYIKMYAGLLGGYPYAKFALVENFWETGYGMPSFTLLGPSILRFPFIINSSYPHEILHVWWGNGVYVDPAAGNWCEGLTSYLADHLIQEQTGRGAEHRRGVLQKYTDFVNPSNDFPLRSFRQRHDSVTEAVGYGKSLMFFHMLRRDLGDRDFVRGLRKFYSDRKHRFATYADIRRALESTVGTNLRATFARWVNTPGAPELRVSRVTARALPGGTRHEVTFLLEQVQSGAAYPLEIPVAVSLEGQAAAVQTQVKMESKRRLARLVVDGRPYLLDIDPEFDVFRRLDRFEIPPAISQVLGALQPLAILPAAASSAEREAYRRAAKLLAGQAEPEVRADSEVTELPKDRAVWVFGAENLFAAALTRGLREVGADIGAGRVTIKNADYPLDNHAFLFTLRHPVEPRQSVGWIISSPDALAGMAAKIPHYGKYSYLAFSTSQLRNVAKGVWDLVHSPLSVPVVHVGGGSPVAGPRAQLAPRPALAKAP